MHLLATAIYTDYKSAYAHKPQVYSLWLISAVDDGQLRGPPERNSRFILCVLRLHPMTARFLRWRVSPVTARLTLPTYRSYIKTAGFLN